MQLIDYLNECFYTKHTLLQLSYISAKKLTYLQQQKVMPAASYRLTIQANCQSFLAEHSEQSYQEYYAKGYVKWLGVVEALIEPADIYQYFNKNYRLTIQQLKQQGFVCHDEKLHSKIDEHIAQEWQHFLAGTYGLCTASGLVEDIARKEFAITSINELIAENEQKPDLTRLTNAVNLLDSASSLFAPHERVNSSRHRLVDQVRKKYRLTY
ncbi:DUF6058 family natural product biosynthesis protein [Thalassotalea sp. 1_MG-2023]|uniref:DUF6058 family natural product biosynthesis protein n=1 Tax=Thalassotalea sp. 1_MG-2023 TaxID=3062680 RepID=UPI0026E1FDF7|nr:DUF6058 family natural product biosynthesis protein [Thalassotalea sp. 1_MG-2023]MDO6428580.1 DUF6058 family natural product biosynthesis protein [Thalassotalea sp. 1_MG-2023]